MFLVKDRTVSEQLLSAVRLIDAGDRDGAERNLRNLLATEPDHDDALNLLSVICLEGERIDEALQHVECALAASPSRAEFHFNRANILSKMGRNDEAIEGYETAIRLKPRFIEAHFNCGNVLMAIGRMDEAIGRLESAVDLKPSFSGPYVNLGKALGAVGKIHEALAKYEIALKLEPDNIVALFNCGTALRDLGRPVEALKVLKKTIELKPDHVNALKLCANVLCTLRRWGDALACFDQVTRLSPDSADAFVNRGNVLWELNRTGEALASYEDAIRVAPDHVGATTARANLLFDLKCLDAALVELDRLTVLHPGHLTARGKAAHTAAHMCAWDGLADRVADLRNAILEGRHVTAPFVMLGLLDDPPILLEASRICVQPLLSRGVKAPAVMRTARRKKIHVAYVSADFFSHATSRLIAELLEEHDRSRVEVTGISLGLSPRDAMRDRVIDACDRFHDCNLRTDVEIAELCRRSEVDIAIDLKGFTRDARPGIFAERCAPIQINYLGYPGSIGAPYMDYILADRQIISRDDIDHYSEKVLWLPGSYQVNDRQRPISDRVFTRSECGLPEEGFVFCCFNNNYKVLPATFDVWMRILEEVPGSVLWLFEDNSFVRANLRTEAAARGADPDRLVFAKRIPLADHLARHRLADLFLDTWPYNAHTTASDALWAGLPLITLKGRSFQARVAASLLDAVGLPDLITDTETAYRELAVALANDPTRLASIRDRLLANRTTSPLFDSQRFARTLETAFSLVMERHWAGLAPDHIEVPDVEASVGGRRAADRPSAPMPSPPEPSNRSGSIAIRPESHPPGSLEAILGLDERIEVMDIGAACITETPVYRPLLDRSIAHLHAFEGDERQIDGIRAAFGDRVTVHPHFLFDGTDRTVHVASGPSGMTSLLRPDPAALGFFNRFHEFGRVLEKDVVATKKLDDVTDLPPIDFIKMDIQGAELTVLKNGIDVLRSCLAVQMDVSFVSLYDDQPTFGEVDVWMRSQGFIPHCFLGVKRWSITPTICNNDFRIPFNQLLEADIVYVRNPLLIADWQEGQLKKLALIAHHSLSSPDLAIHLLMELDRRNRPPPGTPSLRDRYLLI